MCNTNRLAREPAPDPVKGPVKRTRGELKRRDVAVLYDAGLRPAEIAAQLDVSASLVHKVIRLKAAGKSLRHKKSPGGPTFRTAELLRLVEARFEEDPMVCKNHIQKLVLFS